MEKTLFIKILEIIEAYGIEEEGSKIKYSTPISRILTRTVKEHYKNKSKWWQFWKK